MNYIVKRICRLASEMIYDWNFYTFKSQLYKISNEIVKNKTEMSFLNEKNFGADDFFDLMFVFDYISVTLSWSYFSISYLDLIIISWIIHFRYILLNILF